MIDLTEIPIAPNPGQQNADKTLGYINARVMDNMRANGVLKDTGPQGRPFADGEHSLFGYNGVVVAGERIVSLINRKGGDATPPVGIGTEVTIVGDSRDYVSSGHKPGQKVRIIGFIEPFYSAGVPGRGSSDKIIQVQSEDGTIGWIKPSEFDKQPLVEQMKKLREGFGKVGEE